MRYYFQFFLLVWVMAAKAQLIPNPDLKPELMNSQWDASWITCPGSSSIEYGVYFFRSDFELNKIPEKYIIHISADNRYKLYVNGKWIGLGPARCDAENWVFDTYDLKASLIPGRNNIAVLVWNYGEFKPYAQITVKTGLIVQGDDETSAQLNTPGKWKCLESEAFSPAESYPRSVKALHIVGPGDNINASKFPWNWLENDFDNSNWNDPLSIGRGTPKGVGFSIIHALVPRTIPAMELKITDQPLLRKQNESVLKSNEISPVKDLLIPANSKMNLLLDQGKLLTAYPQLKISGGSESSVKVGYAEALFDSQGHKQQRDSVKGMHFKGMYDVYLPDGSENRTFCPLWFRTFRYIEIEIETGSSPLIINELNPIFSAYPLKEKAYFKSDQNDKIDPLWDIAWHTCRLCANETYFDCPYYEQLQYVGDTRIQSLISLYVAGDDRLMRKAINDFYNSINPEGLTKSRYPSDPGQIIPTFSLFWISMIHDYLWYRDDYSFISKYIVSIQRILQWFENRIDPQTGMLGGIEYWPFVDWTNEWSGKNPGRMSGVPDGGKSGNSSIISLQYAMALEQAVDIFNSYGLENLSGTYARQAGAIKDSTRKYCWDEKKGLFADTPDKKSYSQHANAMAILSGAVPKTEMALLMEEVLRNKSLIQGTLYYRFYINRAAIKAGLGNKYLENLEIWEKLINEGFTTFPEVPDYKYTRSDCHAWSSSPLYELIATVAGIQPASPGFSSVIIEPHPGGLKWIKAGMPHPDGEINLDLEFNKKGDVDGTISLPGKLKGLFVWDGQTIDLSPGKQKINLKSFDSRYRF